MILSAPWHGWWSVSPNSTRMDLSFRGRKILAVESRWYRGMVLVPQDTCVVEGPDLGFQMRAQKGQPNSPTAGRFKLEPEFAATSWQGSVCGLTVVSGEFFQSIMRLPLSNMP